MVQIGDRQSIYSVTYGRRDGSSIPTAPTIGPAESVGPYSPTLPDLITQRGSWTVPLNESWDAKLRPNFGEEFSAGSNVAIVDEQVSASKNKPFSLTHSLVGLVLCIAHTAVALDVQPASQKGLYELTVTYLSKSQQSCRPTLGYLRNDLEEVPHVGTCCLPFTAA